MFLSANHAKNANGKPCRLCRTRRVRVCSCCSWTNDWAADAAPGAYRLAPLQGHLVALHFERFQAAQEGHAEEGDGHWGLVDFGGDAGEVDGAADVEAAEGDRGGVADAVGGFAGQGELQRGGVDA